MKYKLYTDKNEDFTCEVSVKNASLKNSVARLVLESENANFVFIGKVNENGKCVIPIKRLQGLINENTEGNISLEVIVENTYFKPWESKFIVEQHTKVDVLINEHKAPSVKMVANPTQNIPNHVFAKEIATLCESFGMNSKNLSENQDSFRLLIKEYFKNNVECKKNVGPILKGVMKYLK